MTSTDTILELFNYLISPVLALIGSSEKLYDGAANNICFLDGNEILFNKNKTFVTFPIDGTNEDPSVRGLPSRVPKSGSSYFFFVVILFLFFSFLYIGSKHPRVIMKFINRIALLTYDHL